MENKFETITVTTESGKQMEAQVIDIIEVPEFNKEYIFYSFGEKLEDNQMKVYVSILIEENEKIILKGIEDDNEWEVVKEILDSMYKEENA